MTGAISALEDLAVERGGGEVDRESWVALLEVSMITMLAGDGLERMAADGPLDGCAEARAALAHAGTEVDAALEALSGHLEPPPIATFDAPATDELCACLTEAAHAGADVPIRSAVGARVRRASSSNVSPHASRSCAPRARATGTGRW